MTAPSLTDYRLLNYDEAARRLGVPVSWVRTQVRNKKLTPVRLGHYVRFLPDDIDAFARASKLGE